MAKRNEEAFQLAQAHREMEHYARSLGDDGTNEECKHIYQYHVLDSIEIVSLHYDVNVDVGWLRNRFEDSSSL
jgi:hypothetical protein